MQHKWENYFDTESEYWEKVQKIYKENDNYPKIVVSGRNLHHKFLRTFSKLEGIEIDNDKENLVSLSEGDHFLVHYYLWKCTKTGYRSRTALPVRFMYKKAAKYLTDEIAELIAKEWICKGVKHSEETKKKIGEHFRGKTYEEMYGKEKAKELRECRSNSNHNRLIRDETKKKQVESHKGKKASKETREKLSKLHKGKKLSDEDKKKKSLAAKGRKWYNNGKIQISIKGSCPKGFVPGMLKRTTN